MEPRVHGRVNLLAIGHQGVPRQRHVVLPAGQLADAADLAVNGAQIDVALIADGVELALWRLHDLRRTAVSGMASESIDTVADLPFESRKLGANFISRIHTPHFGDKSGKLPGERWMVMGRAGEIHQFLADRVVERRLESIALPDGSRRFALLDPNLMVFVRTHGLALAAIGLSERWIFSRAERHDNGFFRQPFGATLRAARRRPLSFTIDPGGHAAAIGRAPRRGDVRTDVRARAVRIAQGAKRGRQRRVVAERIWGLWNETRHKPASRQAIFASRPARKCGLLNTILFERRTTGRRQRLETHEIVSQKSLLIPISQKRILQTSCER